MARSSILGVDNKVINSPSSITPECQINLQNHQQTSVSY